MVACILVLGASSLSGQTRLDGRVTLGENGLSEGTVVFHSVSPDLAGEIDSVRVDSEGRFQFSLPNELDDEERTQIYFASIRHQGVLYFGEAVALTQQLDSLYLIKVFDSEVAPDEGLDLPLSVRNILMEGDDDGWLATDLMRIKNDRDRTIVASDSGVVWSHILPPSATSLELGVGDLPSDAVEFVDGRVVVRAPLPPGERLLLIRYRLNVLPATIPIGVATEVMELLVQEPALPMTAPPLQAVAPVSIEESSYRRYSGQALAAGLPILIEETEPPTVFPVGWMAVLFALLLSAAGLYVYYRPTVPLVGSMGAQQVPIAVPEPGPVVTSSDASAERRSLIVEIARLDERVSALADDAGAERDALLVQRAELMDRLRVQS
jgi:hypothetical protein